MIVGTKNNFVVKVYDIKEKMLVIFNYNRVLNIPPPTFFQKYGNLIMMFFLLFMQVTDLFTVQ